MGERTRISTGKSRRVKIGELGKFADRYNRTAEVRGSNPLGSTKLRAAISIGTSAGHPLEVVCGRAHRFSSREFRPSSAKPAHRFHQQNTTIKDSARALLTLRPIVRLRHALPFFPIRKQQHSVIVQLSRYLVWFFPLLRAEPAGMRSARRGPYREVIQRVPPARSLF